MTSKSAFEISSDQKVHLGSAATKIGKFSWPAPLHGDQAVFEWPICHLLDCALPLLHRVMTVGISLFPSGYC